MSLADAVRSVLTQYAGFAGRARRSEYWYYILAYILASIVVSILDAIIGTSILTLLLGLALFLPSLAVSVRRLHDTNRSGWWILIGIIPLVGAIILLVFYVSEGTAGPNAYGPDPKGAQGAYM